jgi:hypothetical protein
MKKSSILSVLIMALFLLTACGTKSSTTSTANSIMSASELALGTLNLEGTSQAVNSQAAAQLLPLWQLLDELSTNASAAPQEITAAVDSIRATMTSEQITAIHNMQLKEIDVVLAAQGSGSASTGGSTSANSNKTTQVSAGAGAVLAGAGGPPPDGGIAGGPAPSGNSQQKTAASTKSSSGTGTASLIKQVIQLLQSKIQS